jgi:hypothetical protein
MWQGRKSRFIRIRDKERKDLLGRENQLTNYFSRMMLDLIDAYMVLGMI